MNTTTHLLLALGLGLASVVVLALLAARRRPRPSWVVEELDRKARSPRITRSSLHAAFARLASHLRRHRQHRQKLRARKHERFHVPEFLRNPIPPREGASAPSAPNDWLEVHPLPRRFVMPPEQTRDM